MNERPDLGLEAVRRIAKLWLVESDRVRWVEDGFDWWPGRFRVSVRSFKRPDETDGPVWRLTVRTAFLKDVAWHPENTWRAFFLMANLSPTYAWVYMPVELAKLGDKRGIIEEWQDAFADRLVWFQSTVYLRQENAEWLPEFFGQITILQPIEAEWLADTAAQRLGGRPDVTRISETAPRQLDGILDVARTIYAPAGERVSRWEGSEEFAEVAEQFGTFEYCFGVAHSKGVELETPIGSATARIQLHADMPHLHLGTGLVAALLLPLRRDGTTTAHECMWLNFLESIPWWDFCFPQLGTWSPQEGDDGLFECRNMFFVPNALYRPGIASNAAVWQLWHAFWVKRTLWPNLHDFSMTEIARRRSDRPTRPN
jgi:hypothetical protein